MLLGKTNSPGIDITLPDWSAYARPARRHRRRRADARPRGPHRRAALPAARARRHPGHRLAAHPRAGRRQARPAPPQGRPAHRHARASGSTRRRLDPWGLQFFAVNHSIPDALAVAIRVGGQTVLHTGDFKMDQTPLDGRLTDLPGFSRLGDEGVDLLLSDSTNAEVGGFIPSERDVGQVVTDVDPQGAGPDHRRLLRLARAPRPAGARRRRRGRAAGRARRPLDGAQHADRARAGAAARPGRPDGRPEDRRGAARRGGSCSSPPGRRASRCRRCPGWPTARTRPSTSRPTTRSCWRPR